MIESGEALAAVIARYGLPLQSRHPLGGGVESTVIRATSTEHDVVIRVSPLWRSPAELTWAFELATYAATKIPEALAPLPATDGSLAFECDGHVVSVFPFVGGARLDRANERERDAAARLLADMHRVLPAWPSARRRPASRGGRPDLVPNVDPPGLADRTLDAVVTDLSSRFQPAITHGDYYRGNVRCVNHEIVALFDWDDACYWTLENELAWSVWEFAQADDAATLDLDRAGRFLRVYEACGGPVSVRDCSFIIPFIRDDIRTEIREAEAGLAADDAAYVARSYAAFDNLATVVIPSEPAGRVEES
jgi:Ser/Thr protein kinase RdoA (MazF antagonist)